MRKIRLDLEAIDVETFATTSASTQKGTLFGHDSQFQTRCMQTCNLDTTCYESGDMCTAACTGLGVECYTADPAYYACTGAQPCTGQAACTHTTCTVDNVTCNATCTCL